MVIYRVEVRVLDPAVGERAIALLPERYPEVELLAREAGDPRGTELWTVRAPGPAHVEHWCRDADLPTLSIDHRRPSDSAAARTDQTHEEP